MTIVVERADIVTAVCGPNDVNLRVIGDFLGGTVAVRGNEISFDAKNVKDGECFKSVIGSLVEAAMAGDNPSVEFTRSLIESGGGKGGAAITSSPVIIPHGFAKVFARGKNQAAYIQGMRERDITFCVGPAGTGKTYLAIAYALSLVLAKKARKLVLTRPVVEAGESLGFLPGDLAQKINPYLRPLYDAMEALIPYEIINRMEENRVIEIAPLAYMRGRSLNDAFVILDEAQNTTKEQMKMFLTRLGVGSRAVITGDTTQVDLPRRLDSGLLHAVTILKPVDGIHFAYLNTQDVVRNPLIKRIIQAYDSEK
ncbi:MAG: PhoH family protein [Spirochaetaceae bacterium]|nr:PhoH family protein [Spirochaetaceae bacterium]